MINESLNHYLDGLIKQTNNYITKTTKITKITKNN